MRDSASWYIGCSRITELPSGERDEDVVEGGMVRRERRELEPALLHQREERGQRAMQLRHGQRESDAAGARPHGGHATEAPHAVRQVAGRTVRDRELDDVLGPQRGDELARRAERNDLAVIHDRDAVAEALGFLHVVRREQHGAALRAEAANDRPQLPARLRIEAGGRLVENQHLVDRARLPVERSEQRQHLTDLELVGELRFLELDAEPLAQGPSGGAIAPRRAEDLDIPRVRRGQSLENLDGRGLAGAVGPEQAEAFAGPDREIETRDGDDVAEAFGQGAAVDRYDCCFSGSFSGGASWAILSA